MALILQQIKSNVTPYSLCIKMRVTQEVIRCSFNQKNDIKIAYTWNYNALNKKLIFIFEGIDKLWLGSFHSPCNHFL